MEAAFWHAAWRDGKIGFHEGAPNGWLVKHEALFDGAKRVLVPLCGKSEDLAYLAGRGHEVIGVELSEDAVAQFFAAHDVTPAVTVEGGLNVYRAGAITVFAGDFFATTPAMIGPIDAVFDRAALVALPEAMRRDYAAHVRALVPSAVELLVVIELLEGSGGPPFSVPADEVRALFPTAELTELGRGPDARGRPLEERCYALRW